MKSEFTRLHRETNRYIVVVKTCFKLLHTSHANKTLSVETSLSIYTERFSKMDMFLQQQCCIVTCMHVYRVAKWTVRVFCHAHYDNSQKSVGNLSSVVDGNLRREMIVIIDTNRPARGKSPPSCERSQPATNSKIPHS